MADDPRGLLSRFDQLIGTEWLDDDPDHARVRVELRDELRQPVGLLHGGVISTLVESICSRATALAVLDHGMIAMGQSITVSFIRPVTEGARRSPRRRPPPRPHHLGLGRRGPRRRRAPLRARPDDDRGQTAGRKANRRSGS